MYEEPEPVKINLEKENLNLFCEKCAKSFTTTKKFRDHQRLHQMVVCNICNNEVSQHGKARHMRKCGKSDIDKNDDNNNTSAANGEDDFPCDKCDAKFDTKQKLYSHRRIHVTVICPICGKVYRRIV